LVTAEDGIADTIRPRLDLLGADTSEVHWLDVVRSGGKSVALDLDEHLEMLGDWLARYPLVRIVGFDPLAAFMGQVDTHRTWDLRGILGRIAKLAETHNVAVVAISHLTKAVMSAIHRSVGSIAFVAAARAVWQVCADRDVPSRRLFLPVKMNLARASGLAFRITDHGIAWETGVVEISADDAEADQGAEPTSIRPETQHSTRRERMSPSHSSSSHGSPSHGVPHRQEHQLAFSILQNFRSSVPRLPPTFAVSYHHPARLKSQHQNPGHHPCPT